MLARLAGLFRRSTQETARTVIPEATQASPLKEARIEDLDWFMTAIEQASRQDSSPWSLGAQDQVDTLKRTLEVTLRHGLWLQNEYGEVERWQGQLLAYRLGENTPIGMALLTRPDDDAAWQLRFFAVDPEWQARGHAVTLLTYIRERFRELPLRTRVPSHCVMAIHALHSAGFMTMHTDANDIVSLEASAQMK